MDLNINIVTDNDCSVIVLDLREGYLPESFSSTVKDRFKFSETSSIALLTWNKSTGSEIQTPIFIPHDKNDPIKIPVKFDGWFTVNYIVLPTKQWFDREAAKETGSAIPLYDAVYFIDGATVWKAIPSGGFSYTLTESSVQEVLERNTEGTTISRICKSYVSICFLQNCYISLCLQIFKSAGFNPCDKKNQIDSELIYRRDLVWMALNVVKYMVELNQLAEAERVLERISGCNGLCKNEFAQDSNHDCGCGGVR